MYRSRLQKTEEKRNFKKAVWMSLILIALLLVSAVAGFPLLIRFAVFIGEINSSRQPIGKTDLIPPAPPALAAPFEATNSARIQISGNSEPGARIYLNQNSSPLKNIVADDQGLFRFNDVSLNEGRNEFTAVAMDLAGNSSQPSSILRIVFSTKEPNLTIDAPQNNQEFKGSSKIIDFKGKTDNGIQLILNDRVVLVRQDGTFSTKYELNEGENILKVTARDKVGNAKVTELTVRYSP